MAQPETDNADALRANLNALKSDMRWTRTYLGRLAAMDLKRDIAANPNAVLGHWLRSGRPGRRLALDVVEQAVDDGRITMAERLQVVRADFIWRGKAPSDGKDVFVVAEVSSTAGRSDIERAVARADIVARCGLRTVGAVAAERWSGPLLSVAAKYAVLAFIGDDLNASSVAAVEAALAAAG